MHFHICIPNWNVRIDTMNQMVCFMPFILSLSTSSPFWQGQDTGLKSYRSVVIEDLLEWVSWNTSVRPRSMISLWHC